MKIIREKIHKFFHGLQAEVLVQMTQEIEERLKALEAACKTTEVEIFRIKTRGDSE